MFTGDEKDLPGGKEGNQASIATVSWCRKLHIKGKSRMLKTSNEAYKNEGPYIHQEGEVSIDREQQKNEDGTNIG